MIGEQDLHCVSQQRRKMAGHGRDHQHARLADRDVLSEMHQRTEGRFEHHFFDDIDGMIGDDDRLDAECGPLMRDAGSPHHLHRGRGLTEEEVLRRRQIHLVEQAVREMGHAAHRRKHIRLRLIQLIKHRRPRGRQHIREGQSRRRTRHLVE